MPFCEKKAISVIIGGPYNSGILASDLQEGVKYNYCDAHPEVLVKAHRIKIVCDRYNAPLKAATLQFVLAHPAVVAVIPGTSSPVHVEENVRMVQYPIPQRLWEDLRDEGLIAAEAPVPQLERYRPINNQFIRQSCIWNHVARGKT